MQSTDIKGKRVLVTCSASRAESVIPQLRNLGAEVIYIPLVEIREPSDQYATLDLAIEHLEKYCCIVFTSKNAVEAFFSRMGDRIIPENLKLAAVGPATAAMLSQYGAAAVIVPERSDAEALLQGLLSCLKRGERVLWPRARRAREVLTEGLRAHGIIVDDIEAYQTAMPQEVDRARLLSIVEGADVDVVLFDSPSAVANFVEVVGKENAIRFAKRVELIPIGSVTAASIKSALS